MPARSSARSFRAATAFLTRVPVGRSPLGASEVAKGAVFFPLVGAVIGAFVGGLAALLAKLGIPPFIAAALGVAAGTCVTGAMHLDALADSIDALGIADRRRSLQVMRDPTIGAFGAAAIVLDLVVKIAALGVLVTRGRAVWSVIAVAAIARAAPLMAGALMPYAHETAGSGSIVTDGVPLRRAVVASAIAVAVALAALRIIALWPLAVAACTTIAWTFVCSRRFGGITGDTLGANVEICETLGLAVLSAF